MKKLLCAILVLATLALPVLSLPAGAVSVAPADVIVSDLIPTHDNSFYLAIDCDVSFPEEGSMAVTVTGNNPRLYVTLAEGTILYTGSAIDVSKPAYLAVDLSTRGEINIPHMILHYTRKDKAAAGTVADMYLQSMLDDNYAVYLKQHNGVPYDSWNPFPDGANFYAVWDWGTYVSSSESKRFDDNMHYFTDIDLNLSGSAIGSTVYFHTIAVVSDPEVKLGHSAPESAGEGDFLYELYDDGAHVMGYTGPGGKVTVPDTLGGKPVSAIYNFGARKDVTSVVLPDTLKTIDQYAFTNCAALSEINLPEGLRSIGLAAFTGCDLLQSIHVPSTVSSIGTSAFGGEGITSLTVAEGNTHYYSAGNCIIERGSEALIQGCGASVIPDGVKVICVSAFSGVNRLEKVVIPDSVKVIEDYAFFGATSLTEVTLGKGLTTIGSNAFCVCRSLKTIHIPASVTTVGEDAFFACSELTDIYCDLPFPLAGWDENWLRNCDATVHWADAVLGDIGGNGEVDATDYMLLKRYVLGTYALTDGQKTVADVNGDNAIDALDYMLVKRHVLGTFKIG